MKSPTSLLTLVATLSALSIQNIRPAEVDTTFAAQINGTVHALSVDAFGNITAGGEFNSVNETPRNNLVRLTTNGAIDNTFTLGTDGPVFALAADSQNALYLAGAFNSPSRHLARINSAGELAPLAIGTSTSSRIKCLALGTDGSLAFGGPFRDLDGVAALYTGKLTAAGAIDAAFNSGLLSSMSLEAGADAIALQPDGKVIVGGNFNTPSGFATLVRLNADGSLDETFSGDHGSILYPKNITLLENGQILVAGVANSSGEGFVRRLHANGSVDNTFQAPLFQGWVHTVSSDGNGGLIVGGSFAGGLARLTANGALDNAWNISTDGAVTALAPRANDAILVGGSFRTIGNVSQSSLARIKFAAKSNVTATNAGGRFLARLQGDAGKTYEIESSTDLNSWAFFGTTTATDAGIEITDTIGVSRKHRFFRGRLVN
jgi:uncharacterized delta-60 repeat protein